MWLVNYTIPNKLNITDGSYCLLLQNNKSEMKYIHTRQYISKKGKRLEWKKFVHVT